MLNTGFIFLVSAGLVGVLKYAINCQVPPSTATSKAANSTQNSALHRGCCAECHTPCNLRMNKHNLTQSRAQGAGGSGWDASTTVPHQLLLLKAFNVLLLTLESSVAGAANAV